MNKKLPTPDRDLLIHLYESEELSLEEIGKRFGVSETPVQRWFHELDISIRKPGRHVPSCPDRNKLYRLYVDEEMTEADLADHYSVSCYLVAKWLHLCGIPTRHQHKEHPGCDLLCRLYLEKRMTTVEIAERLAVSSTLVGQWLQQCNIDARPSGSGLDARGIVAPTAEELQRMVHEEYLSYAQIAERFGVDQSAVPHWLDKHGVDRSDVRETRWGGPIPDEDEILRLYSSGKSLRSIAKLYGVSKSTVRALCIEYGIPLRRDGFRHGQRFDCIDGHRVRSTYEKHVDDWLHRHGIEHVYEPILPCDTRYHADFRANGWYIEVWGVTQSETYDARKQRKIDLYLAHSIPLIEVPYYAFQTARKGLWKRLLAQCQQPPSTQYSLFPLEDLSS